VEKRKEKMMVCSGVRETCRRTVGLSRTTSGSMERETKKVVGECEKKVVSIGKSKQK
jgi:hypothetical protein